MTNNELEALTGINGQTVYAKNALWQILDMMRARYGNNVTSNALTEVYLEIYGTELGDPDE